ncbi:glycosyltransferase [Paraburkholderia silviterrae]|uniref:Glycosyltransferase n=1 Tax=Paraburkholderia silviterrae TaxID=2528715 RepID=A0A4R5LYD2_9BURK|nr:glycosyltransferase [Paraburkholderia silviterrae]TDG17393.1 glycosyltransferase [Paraburkholderia silviterrae]
MHFLELPVTGATLSIEDEAEQFGFSVDAHWLRSDHFNLQSIITSRKIESVLVLGAGSGVIPLFLASLFPNRPVCVVESFGPAIKLLKRNAKNNGLVNISIIEGALTDGATDQASLYADRSNHPLSYSEDRSKLRRFTSIKDVPAISFANVRAAANVERFDLVFVSRWPNSVGAVLSHMTANECGYLAGYLDRDEDPVAIKFALKKLGIPAFVRSDDRQHFLHETLVEKDLLSVVLPIYNVAQYLPACFESLLAAAPQGTEFLAVNDGSPDNSEEVISQWARKYPNIRLINKPNGGCASARSAGLREAKGEYVAFVDPDDWLFPDSLRRLCQAAFLGSVDIVQGGFVKYYESTSKSELIDETWVANDFREKITDQGRIRGLLTTQPTIWRRVYKRRFLLENGLDFYHEIRRFDDLPFQFEALSLSRSFKAIPDFIYNYRLQRPGQDVAVTDNRLFVHFDIFALLDAFTRKLGAQQVSEQLLRVKLNTHAWAVGQIASEFKQEYLKRAKDDIWAAMTYLSDADFKRVTSDHADFMKLLPSDSLRRRLFGSMNPMRPANTAGAAG